MTEFETKVEKLINLIRELDGSDHESADMVLVQAISAAQALALRGSK